VALKQGFLESLERKRSKNLRKRNKMVFGFGRRREPTLSWEEEKRQVEQTYGKGFTDLPTSKQREIALGSEAKIGTAQKKISKLSSEKEAKRLKLLKSKLDWQGRVAKRLSPFEQGRPVEDFTQHEQTLRSMFGHGGKMWGNIREPVTINNDLNPRQRGDTETASMFGF